MDNSGLYYAILKGGFMGVFTNESDYKQARCRCGRGSHRICESLHEAEEYIGMGGDYCLEKDISGSDTESSGADIGSQPMVVYIGSAYRLSKRHRHLVGYSAYYGGGDTRNIFQKVGINETPSGADIGSQPMVVYIGSAYRLSKRHRHLVGYSAYYGGGDTRNIFQKVGINETPSVHRGELLAIKRVVAGMCEASERAHKVPRPLHMFTALKDIAEDLTTRYLKWKDTDWKRMKGEPVAHQDVIKAILELVDLHGISLTVEWMPRASRALGNSYAFDLAWRGTF
ncbi:hypothetical protein GQ54DRAFT_310253 [Martensiomyces pterosporus]|nr:hypothetical protein GQ54DRAFT_310253 [Martensiomyces pterosporus]